MCVAGAITESQFNCELPSEYWHLLKAIFYQIAVVLPQMEELWRWFESIYVNLYPRDKLRNGGEIKKRTGVLQIHMSKQTSLGLKMFR